MMEKIISHLNLQNIYEVDNGHTYVYTNFRITPKDGVKMDIIRLTTEVIDINALIAEIASPKCGAVSTFIGTTRDNFENKTVLTH